MKLDHVALYVNDLEGSKAFFMKYFDAVPNEKYHNPRTGLMTYFLTFADSGGARAAAIYSLIGTAQLTGVDPKPGCVTC